MRKLFLPAVLVFCTLLFTSCGENFMQGMFELVSGKANVTINNGETEDFTSSIAMFSEEEDNPYLIGLSSNLDIDDLMNMSDENAIPFPFLCYRFVGNDLATNKTLSVNNTLTNEDLVNFDYTSLMNGKFAENHVIGYALSKTQFYVMKTGTVKFTKVTGKKVVGTFNGTAYFIDLEADPMISEEEVVLSGNFTSRVIPMMKWLKELQEENE